MRLPVNRFASRLTSLTLISLLAACGGGTGAESVPALATTGPAADYPMVIGAPFVIDGVTHTPNDRMNYDAVGFAGIGVDGGAGVSVAHRTMPLPSYLEVTALDTGKTILARVERRGPMTNAQLVELSPGAAAQLGLGGRGKAPIRVRRVNPPEAERALLRAGQAAPERMDTPKSLLAVLTRKLEAQEGIVPIAAPSPTPSATPTLPAKPPVRAPKPQPIPSPAPVAAASPAPAPVPAAAVRTEGKWAVQVAAFSTRDRANAAAAKLGGQVSPAGKLWRVQMGSFATQAQAQAALAKAHAAGYKDARIQRAD
jgi:rare lipoprotein A